MKKYLILFFLMLMFIPANNKGINKVWIFAGLAGNDEYREDFLSSVDELNSTLKNNYSLEKENIRILFDKGINDKYKACNLNNLKEEFKLIQEANERGDFVWIIFAGHANSLSKKGVNFNLVGKDINAEEIALELSKCNKVPVGIFVALPSANRFIKPLASTNRFVVFAVDKENNDNQPVYFSALVKSFKDKTTDTNKDGSISAVELFFKTKLFVAEYYKNSNLVQKEQSTADGNGDGKASVYPVGKESAIARKLKLLIKTP